MTSQDKDVIGKIIISQLIRVPENIIYFFKKIPEYEKEMKNEYIKSFPKAEQGKIRNKIKNISLSKEMVKQSYLNKCFEPEFFNMLLNILKKRPWVVYLNTIDSRMPFITSDNPVVLYDVLNDNTGVLNVGLASKSSIIDFPITPSIAIQIFSNIEPFYVGNVDGKKYDIDDELFIIGANVRIMQQAYRQSYLPKAMYKQINHKSIENNL